MRQWKSAATVDQASTVYSRAMAGASPGASGPRETTASNLLLEAVAGQVVEALRREGIRSVLFKGPTTVRWLYHEDSRAYGDVDLLVDPARFDECERVVETMGFRRSTIEQVLAKGRPSHASTWIRGSVAVDLHRTLVGVSVPAVEAWAILSAQTETWLIGRAEVEVLGVAARTLVLALHMAQHGPGFARTSEDLERAVQQLPVSTWSAAADLSRALHAEAPLAAGLLASPDGRALCDVLGLRVEGEVAIEGAAGFHAAQGLLWLSRQRGMNAKAHYLLRKLFPPPTMMRNRVVWARQGRTRLALAYGLRLVRVVYYGPYVLWALARLRRRARAE
jgi:hypothetical protein